MGKTNPSWKVQRMTGAQRQPRERQRQRDKERGPGTELWRKTRERKGKQRRRGKEWRKHPQRVTLCTLALGLGGKKQTTPTYWPLGQGTGACHKCPSAQRSRHLPNTPCPGDRPPPSACTLQTPDWTETKCPQPHVSPVGTAFLSFLSWTGHSTVCSLASGHLYPPVLSLVPVPVPPFTIPVSSLRKKKGQWKTGNWKGRPLLGRSPQHTNKEGIG